MPHSTPFPAPIALNEVLREGARDALRVERVRRIHQLEMQVRGGRVPGVAKASDHRTGADLLSPRQEDALRREMRVEGIPPPGPGNHVIPSKTDRVELSPRESKRERVLQREPGLPHNIKPLALGHTVHGLHDLAVERRMNRLPLSVAIPRPSPDQVPAQGSRRVQMEPAAVAGPDKVVREPLAEHVGAVARDPVRRRPLHRPLAAEGELDDDRVVKLTHRSRPDAR